MVKYNLISDIHVGIIFLFFLLNYEKYMVLVTGLFDFNIVTIIFVSLDGCQVLTTFCFLYVMYKRV